MLKRLQSITTVQARNLPDIIFGVTDQSSLITVVEMVDRDLKNSRERDDFEKKLKQKEEDSKREFSQMKRELEKLHKEKLEAVTKEADKRIQEIKKEQREAKATYENVLKKQTKEITELTQDNQHFHRD